MMKLTIDSGIFFLLRGLLCVVFFGAAISTSLSADWPGFRGPEGTGVSSEKDVPLHWSAEKNIVWKTALEGTGNGSPIVSKGTLYVTIAKEKGRKRILQAFDRVTGKLKWSRTVEVSKEELTHKTNPYAGTTPASNGNVVVVWHGSGGLHCYDSDGGLLWKKEFGELRHIWGYGTSPVISGENVILFSGPCKNQFIASFRLKDGSVVWKKGEPGGTSNEKEKSYYGSWCTPIVTKSKAGKKIIICGMQSRVVAYRFDDGKIEWFCKGLKSVREHELVYSSPHMSDEICVVLGGFKGPAIGVRRGGTGDVTESHRLWKDEKRNPQRIGSGIVLKGKLYLANADGGSVQCIDMKTGESLWRDRLPGGAHWGSTVFAAGRLYATNQSGVTHVFSPREDRLEILATNRLGEPSNSTPAISEGQIFIRTSKGLYCIGKTEKE